MEEKRWYAIHTQTGYEAKVKESLMHRLEVMGFQEFFGGILIPMEDVSEIRGGKKRVSQRKFFPGYILIEMIMNDETWYLVKNTPGVSGFVGAGRKPVPLKEKEVSGILQEMEERKSRPKPKVEFEKGDGVKVISGPFVNFSGIVEEVSPDRGRLKITVSIFGRSTPMELEYWQVERV